MITTTGPESARRLAIARYRHELAELDYRREIAQAPNEGMSQTEIARTLGISGTSIGDLLHQAGNTPRLRQGFSGAGPYEICR